jgi:hypothetical protein
LEVKGDLELKITDSAFTKVRLQLSEPSSSGHLADAGELQYKTHPHVDKAAWGASRLISLKDANRPFPLNQNLGVLRWRLTSKDESLVPLSISCWPSVSGDGTGEVNVEFELEAKDLVLQHVVIAIPLPEGAGQNLSAEAAVGGYSVDEDRRVLLWTIDQVDASSPSGSLEFTVSQGAEAADVFFPVNVDFVSEQTLSATKVSREGATNLD